MPNMKNVMQCTSLVRYLSTPLKVLKFANSCIPLVHATFPRFVHTQFTMLVNDLFTEGAQKWISLFTPVHFAVQSYYTSFFFFLFYMVFIHVIVHAVYRPLFNNYYNYDIVITIIV